MQPPFAYHFYFKSVNNNISNINNINNINNNKS